MDLNIVIVNWKAKEDIEKCLESLFKDLEGNNLDFVVQVVDNSDNADGIREMLKERFPQVKYKNSGGNIGFGKAQNLGLKEVEAKYYLPLNPDICFYPPFKTLEGLISFLEKRKEVGIVARQLLNPDGSVQYSCYRFPGILDQVARRMNWGQRGGFFKKRIDYYLMRDFDHKQSVPVDWVMGSFMLARQELIKEIGFFDDRFFMYFEDCDWCRRAWENNWQVFYHPKVKVIHEHRRETAEKKPFCSLFKNPLARTHLKSWLKYFRKWGFRKKNFGK